MERRQTPDGNRSSRTLDQNKDAKRGVNRVDRNKREQGVALDERGQEQPSDYHRAHDPQHGGLNQPPPKRSNG